MKAKATLATPAISLSERLSFMIGSSTGATRGTRAEGPNRAGKGPTRA
jgi:hypothetical protein